MHFTRTTILPSLSSSSPSQDSGAVDMKHEQSAVPHEGKLLRGWRCTYKAIGFSKAYNFVLFFVFAGAMLGFVLARFQYLAIGTVYAAGAAPGDWYWFRGGIYRIGITMHLGAILPAGFLMIWQFVPWIRHHAILFHRINGWTITILVLVANVGALMIARRSFGGEASAQAGTGLLAIITTGGLFMAVYNIKRLQIDQHRAWMLRTVFWLGTIVTMRLIMIITALLVSKLGSYSTVSTCAEVMYVDGNSSMNTFPQCWVPGASAGMAVAVPAAWKSAMQVGSSLRLGFSTGLWLAIFLHTVGVEIYLSLTPREADRLRQISYERQKAAGFKHPGSSGLTVDRWGDTEPWTPATDLEAKAAERE